MTKQEVMDKIRYNENLINQYNRDLNALHRQIDSLNGRINQLNNQLGQLNARRHKLQTELSELQALKSKFQKLQNDFASRQRKRVSGFNQNTIQLLSVRFILSYISGMKNLLSGAEYRSAYNGLSAAIDKINKQIQAKQRELD